MLVQWLARIVFTFNYKKNMKYSIALFGGIAATSIIYFMLIKGLKDSSFMTPENKQWIHDNTALLITGFLCILHHTDADTALVQDKCLQSSGSDGYFRPRSCLCRQ